ncbi:MAG: dihydrodipicolinate synthase family protein, partial [Dehalococcoidales bacterium]|nr:dihydrodipicolinate synthase family protein [Dehalococcoidales bacterium]
ICAVPSFYYQIGFDQVKDVFKRLVDAVSIPVWVYNNPPTTRVTMTVDLIVQLAELGTKGFKDSSASLKLFQDVLQAVDRDDFTIMQGTPFLAFPSFIAGADGYIGGLATVYPQFLKAMFVAVKEGDAKRAVELERATPELFALTGGPFALTKQHAVLRARGCNAGQPRSPFAPVTAAEMDWAKQAAKRADELLQSLGLPL